MNCRRTEELIPLYAGGDIDRRLTSEVQSHLEKCSGCADLAVEYKAGRNWLFEATPEFEEELLADMKRGVMRELEGSNSRPGLFEMVTQVIAHRTPLRPIIVAAMLLIAIGAMTLWLYFAKPDSRAPIQAVVTEDQKDKAPKVVSEPERSAEPKAPQKESRIRYDHRPRVARFMKSSRRLPSRVRDSQVDTPIANLDVKYQPPQAPALMTDPEAMLRIEIQTSDPTIRIIWFAPKEVETQLTNE